jgi:hypothetical protein
VQILARENQVDQDAGRDRRGREQIGATEDADRRRFAAGQGVPYSPDEAL